MRRRLDDRETHVCANVEDQNLDRADLALDPLDERRDIGFDPGVEPERIGFAAFGADRFRQRVDGVGVARPSGDADAEALASEGARDRSAESVAGPDHQADAAFRLAHKPKPGPETAPNGADHRAQLAPPKPVRA